MRPRNDAPGEVLEGHKIIRREPAVDDVTGKQPCRRDKHHDGAFSAGNGVLDGFDFFEKLMRDGGRFEEGAMHVKSSNEGGENALHALCELGRNSARENGEGAEDGERAVEYEGKDYGFSYLGRIERDKMSN